MSTKNEKNGECIDCGQEKIIYKSQRCHECFKKFDAERAKKKRQEKSINNVSKEAICIDCKELTIIRDAGKCDACFKKRASERTKKCRDIKKEELKVSDNNIEQIPENHKKCNTCNEIKEIGDFYVTNGNKCKECSKLFLKEIRKNAKIKEENTICKKCDKEKTPLEFRPNRRVCKDCEKAYGRNYVKKKSINVKNKSDTSDSDIDSDTDSEKSLDKNEYYLQKVKERRKKENLRLKNDFEFKLSRTCRHRIYSSIKKNYKTDEYVGCSTDFLKEWINFCLKDDMTFENHGKFWHVDHVIPVNKFNLQNDGEQFLCFNWKNLSPETASFNLKKGNDIIKIQVENHIKKLIDFHKLKNIPEPQDYIAFLKSKI